MLCGTQNDSALQLPTGAVRVDVGQRLIWLGASAAVLPDVDLFARPFVPVGSWFEHRGITHSLVVACLVATLVARMAFRRCAGAALTAWFVSALSYSSHCLLDTATTYGSGVALLAPLSTHRFAAPYRPLGDIGASDGRSLAELIVAVIANEVLWIGVPCLLLWLAARHLSASTNGLSS
jgi:inner membrane protein